MTDRQPKHCARTSYGTIGIPPWRSRQMAAHHRKVGHLAYRLFRYEMEVGHAKRELRKLLRDMREARR